ncbi:uncharacterized protein RCC_06079 [Ramularia collo-cygni]|uniref:Piwi domain-containing protein n=1 Tax=Ramularia collo-cygni TaxID=112498 RepID=A0A2D3USD3_9PEZI|nr:uncharacterized protein RCC_06079 [Ramularia collo-cygni]CZT20222.1 uncharacterized protein RCC_06079 [Ramularia collo-cygni]
MGLNADQLYKITFSLCWTFARALTPISYASPAYYADLLAERGRSYLVSFLSPVHPRRAWLDMTMAQMPPAPTGMTPGSADDLRRKDDLLLNLIRTGWGPPSGPNWVNAAKRPSPQHSALGNTMFYI